MGDVRCQIGIDSVFWKENGTSGGWKKGKMEGWKDTKKPTGP